MEKKKILLICDDVWHPAEVIEKGLLPLINDTYDVDMVKAAKDILTPEMLPEYDLIICCKSNNVTSGNPEPWFENTVTEVAGPEFQAYVENGGAFLSVHSGNAFFGEGDGVKEYTEFVGNRFVGHPLRCEIQMRTRPVLINSEADSDNSPLAPSHSRNIHPILEGVSHQFLLRDEHYQIELLAEDADIFLTSHSAQGGDQIAGYTRTMCNGRLCVLIPGHTLAVWKNPDYGRLFRNAVAWCLEH